MQGLPDKKGAKSSCIGVGFRFSSAQQIEDAPVSAAEGLHPDNFLFTNPARIVTIKSNPSAVRCVLLPGSVRPAALHPQTFSRLWHSAGPRRYVFLQEVFPMKITRRTVLRLTGAAAASLALSSCSASGSAILGSNFSCWLQQTLGISSSGAASSAASSEDMAASSLAAGGQPAARLAALPAYDADPLTGEAKRSNGRIVGVMVNNISNTSRQNARPQRGILSSADLLIECKVQGGITRFCAGVPRRQRHPGGRAAALRP